MLAGDVPFEQGGDPTNDEQRYRLLEGSDPTPLPPPDPGTGLRPTQLSSTANDHRIVISVGPFDVIEPGETFEVDFALVIGRFFDGMIESAAQAKLTYDGVWFDRDADPATGVGGAGGGALRPRLHRA